MAMVKSLGYLFVDDRRKIIEVNGLFSSHPPAGPSQEFFNIKPTMIAKNVFSNTKKNMFLIILVKPSHIQMSSSPENECFFLGLKTRWELTPIFWQFEWGKLGGSPDFLDPKS